ncbi:Negative elongation factor A [Carabus blaptoides fortunei]
MANVRDSDTCLWLHNKLGISNDSWTGGSICSQLNAEVLRNIKDCFPDLQTQVKLKLLLSFFHIPRRNVEEWRLELEEIIEVAALDSELWVAMLAETMKTFPATGSLNTEISDLDEVRPIFTDLVNDLRKLVKKQFESGMLPMECHYLNKAALVSVVGQQPAPSKHFNQKKKPKSALLRVELLQKSNDAASNLKKASAPVIPVRSRGMPRKMTDTTPLKGIPSRVPSSGFRASALTSPNVGGRPLPRTPAGRKDGGIKLLDIADQPLGYAAAKKRKRMQDLEEAKKTPEPGNAIQSPGTTPDYAAGLSTTTAYTPSTPQHSTTPATPTTTRDTPTSLTSTTTSTSTSVSSYSSSTSAQVTPTTPTTPITPYTPTTAVKLPAAPVLLTPTHGLQLSESSASSPATPAVGGAAVASTTVQATPAAAGLVSTAAAAGVQSVVVTRPIQQITQIRLQPQPVGNTLQKKGLALTREQMLEAQDMFRTANKVTRPEKALILGFMAGSRDNPCPHLGNIVTIKLSEDQENVLQADDTYLTMMVETHFQMNYNNGEWKRIKKFRTIENSEPVPVTAASQSATAMM